ncbi:hypothetical protein [Sphingomonas sp. LT1P40]|uniref:hypothetical protein n=1 Tax=Alteristakelama amylovorans TaxID=3096166 RepID=UPI002FC67712
MIRLTVIAVVLLTAAPAIAERWRQVPGGANASLSIDLDSVKRDGPWRVFRTRTTSLGMPGAVIGVVAMHCQAGITELRAQRAFAKGKMQRERVFPLGKRPRQKLPNPAKDPAFRMVCG